MILSLNANGRRIRIYRHLVWSLNGGRIQLYERRLRRPLLCYSKSCAGRRPSTALAHRFCLSLYFLPYITIIPQIYVFVNTEFLLV